MRHYRLLHAIAWFCTGILPANADSSFLPLGPSQSDFGGTGLLQVPTARIVREGEFSLNIRNDDQYRFYSASISLFPWLETTLRYTDVRTRLYSPYSSFSGSQTYKDKSFDVKIRLMKEGFWMPQVAIGKRDFGGTGLFDSEYLVANKMVGPLDFTLGIGWGYLGNSGNISNPFCSYSEKYCRRPTGEAAGDISFNDSFRGPASVFAGIEYQTPWRPLRLKLEYEGNNYRDDFAGTLTQSSKFNVGSVYRLADWLDITASYERGNTFMLGATLRSNLRDLRPSFVPGSVTSGPELMSANLYDDKTPSNSLKYDAGFTDTDTWITGDTLYFMGQQDKFRSSQKGIARANTLLLSGLPRGIKTLSITQERNHLPLVTTRTPVANLRMQSVGYPLGYEKSIGQTRIDPDDSIIRRSSRHEDPAPLNFHFSPVLNQSVGGPESFYMYQLGVLASADYWLTDHIQVNGGIFGNLANNYDQFKSSTIPTDSSLPHVRTHVRDYGRHNIYVNNLQANYFKSMGRGLYGQVYGGYLETMFGGIGSEILYRPLDAGWALGLDVNYVGQRDWDNMMHFSPYKVWTGHATAYWHPKILPDFLVKLSVGQYLAKDKGATIDLSKQFANGVTVGAYTTLTNVSKKAYGEGSFTKGFYIAIPLDLMTVVPTRSVPTIRWSPLTRDGGQMLGREYSLYGMTSERDEFHSGL